MDQMIAEYLNYLKVVKNSSKNTIDSYGCDLKQLSKYLIELGITSFEQVTETNLNSFILYLEKQKISAASINRKLVSVRNFILFGIKRGYLHQDVTERIKPPRFERKNPKGLSIDQIEALLNAPDLSTIRGRRDKAMLELLYATGMKVSELISLKREDVVVKLKYVVVKEKSGERLLPFGQAAMDALCTYLNEREELDNDFLFYNRFQKAMTRQGFWKILKEYADKSGITDITPQVIRNSFALHMLENGADLYSLQELLGHGDISITQRYTNQTGGKTREVYLKTHPRGR